MNWTTEFPTRAGYYWLRNYRFEDEDETRQKTVIVSISNWGGLAKPQDLDFTFTGNDQCFRVTSLASAEWYGPLEPPE